MSASRYAVVRRLSRVLLLPLHGHSGINDRMRHRKAKDSSSLDDQRICTKNNCLTCCKKFTAFMFSRVGLFFVMIGYVALGGWLFQALEARNEQDMRHSMNEKLNSTLYKLWDEILRVNSYPYHDKKGNFTLYASQELEKFEATVIKQVQKGFDGRTRPGADPDWNYFGAVLYAVTLVSTIGYGHITTKTVAGKIATVLYSAFGVPLMMLFVTNIGSTTAKLFAFVFTRIRIIFCCGWRNKNKRVSLKKTPKFNTDTSITIDESRPITKSSLKSGKDNREVSEKIPIVDELANHDVPLQRNSTSNSPKLNENKSATLDTKHLPADVRLNMLTGVPTISNKSPLLGSTRHATDERSKDALDRINELIRKSSVPNAGNKINEEIFNDNDRLLTSTHQRQRQKSDDIHPIEFYINETNKLTSNLENAIDDKNIIKSDKEKLDNVSQQQTGIPISDDTNKPTTETFTLLENILTHKLKRSRSESTHDRASSIAMNQQSEMSPVNTTTNNNRVAKSPRRRFFLRKSKKQSLDETNRNESLEQDSSNPINENQRKLPRRSLSFNGHLRSISPPPDYEEPIVPEKPTVPTVTWKPGDELQSSKTIYSFPTNAHIDDDDEEYYEDEEMSVPLLVTVFVIPLYLTLGAILFNIWEKWGFLNSFYFCFTTLTTIGFGDFVPGASITVRAAKEKLICASLYILLGLVLIAMCFNLMKEQLSQKVKKIASKWGILEL